MFPLLRTALTRRTLLRSGTVTALSAALPARALRLTSTSQHALRTSQARLASLADQASMRDLAGRAIESAMAAGATYAEARVTRTVTQDYAYFPDLNGRASTLMSDIPPRGHVNDYLVFGTTDEEHLAVGVRAYVENGSGFAATSHWTLESAAEAGRAAVALAKANGKSIPERVDLTPAPAVTGTWVMPGIDPFSISPDEKMEFMDALANYFHDRQRVNAYLRYAAQPNSMNFYRQERVLVTSAGTSIAQTVYRSGGTVVAGTRVPPDGGVGPSVPLPGLTLSGVGWELFLDAKLEEKLPEYAAIAKRQYIDGAPPEKPVELGRFDVVCDAATMSGLIDASFGRAMELDRTLGWEANASGTSYLGPDPLANAGTYHVGSPLLNVTANRSMPGGLATVKWDDEGVVPSDTPLVKDGVVVNYQTTRELAGVLGPYYQKQGRPVVSNGCAGSESGSFITQQCTPNLVMESGKTTSSFNDMIASIKRGVALFGAHITTDYQCRAGAGEWEVDLETAGRTLNGNPIIRPCAREIVNGRLGAVLRNAGFLFDTTQVWKNLVAVGRPNEAAVVAKAERKGEPVQRTMYSVQAVPGLFRDMAMIDTRRKA